MTTVTCICFYFQIESLEDTIREKEDQLSQARVRLTSTFTESPSDTTLSTLEEALVEKDKQIERWTMFCSLVLSFAVVISL